MSILYAFTELIQYIWLYFQFFIIAFLWLYLLLVLYFSILVNIVFNGCIFLYHMDEMAPQLWRILIISNPWAPASRLNEYGCELGVLPNSFSLNHNEYSLLLTLIYCVFLEKSLRGLCFSYLTHKTRNMFPIWHQRHILWVKWDVRRSVKNDKGPEKCKIILFLMLSCEEFKLMCVSFPEI